MLLLALLLIFCNKLSAEEKSIPVEEKVVCGTYELSDGTPIDFCIDISEAIAMSKTHNKVYEAGFIIGFIIGFVIRLAVFFGIGCLIGRTFKS